MPLEEDLKQIDHEIRRLKVQYDLYFSGRLGRPPTDQREALARQLRKYQGMEMRNLAERFMYNNVANKFNTFLELWSKRMRIKEEGERVHPLAVRAAHRSARPEHGGSAQAAPPPDISPAAGSPAAGATAAGAGGSRNAAAGGSPHRSPAAQTAFRIPAQQGQDEALRTLYKSFVAARQNAGDQRPIGFDSFAREVTRQTAAIKGKVDCEAVEFRIYSQDNKVTLKARPAGSG
jgi:hypothetical protein